MNDARNTDDVLRVLVHGDSAPVFEHKAKIERLFSVTLLLDSISSATWYHRVGVKGDPRDRLNAKIYILSLVKCKFSTCTEEKRICLPKEINDDVIESVERRTTAAIVVDGKEEGLYYVRGSTLSVNAAMTAMEEEIGDRAVGGHSGSCTPKTPQCKASRRLSLALHETLTKQNQKGNYVNASDAVKRAIASCLIEDPDDKQVDDDDVILIEGDSDEAIEPIVIEDDDDSDNVSDDENDDDSDDDVMIIETPKATKSQTETDQTSDNVFPGDSDKDNNPSNHQTVEQLTKAFGDMKTPSKSISKPKGQHNKVKAAVKPLNFNNCTKRQSADNFTVESGTSEEVKGKDDTNLSKKIKKRTLPKLDDDTDDVITFNYNKTAVQRRGKLYLADDIESHSKRQRLKSAVTDGGKESSINTNTVPPRIRPSRFSDELRYIVIDGSNVAMAHGQGRTFSCKGIQLCVDYFRNRGHTKITVFLPHWRKCRARDPNSITHRYVLDDLETDGYLVYTPSRRIGNKLVASYDDRYVIELAEREDGVVVSNDQYRDLLHEKHSWRRVIETRLLMYTFVRDHFMPPDDPYGKNGPLLDELLRRSKTKPPGPLNQDMYSTLKYLEASNPRSERREADRDYYSYRAARY